MPAEPDVPASTAARGPVTAAERSLAPDLARGAMLLLIAVANAVVYLYDRPYTARRHLAEGSGLDRVVTFAEMTLVDGRAYPMFAALFGYGMVQLFQRQTAAGTPWTLTQQLLVRRNWWLVGFGFGHALLLFSGDILGSYGLAGMLLLPLLRASDGRLIRVAWLSAIPVAVLGVTYGIVPAAADTERIAGSMRMANPLEAAYERVLEWAVNTPFGALGVLLPVTLGVWAGRRRVLDEPERHRALLRRTAVLGLGAAILGGLPLALTVAQVWPSYSPATDLLFGSLHTLAGTAGGLGYAALIGLVATHRAERRGPIVDAVAACGARSLTFYLAQSVVFVLVLSPYVGGLGARLGTAEVTALAVATWMLSVVAADLLRRAGRRGPAEVLLRRLTYRVKR